MLHLLTQNIKNKNTDNMSTNTDPKYVMAKR